MKCDCAHTADVSVLGEPSSAQEENVVLVALTSAVLLGGTRKGLPQAGKGHFIFFIIHIFLTEAALHRGKGFPLGFE